jgi:cation-transporting ATPase 13A3/4/5
MVKSTGFQSTKGQMVRGMLLITDAQFSFYIDAIKFLGIMLLIALVCVAVTVKPMIDQEYSTKEMWFRLLDILTIAVPPALPASLTASVLFSLNRLKKQGIFCRSPPRILIGGRVKTMVFDKTGTLTEESIEGFVLKGEGEIRKQFSDAPINPLGHTA